MRELGMEAEKQRELFERIQVGDVVEGVVKNVTDFYAVKTMDKAAAIEAGLYNVIGAEIDDAYMAELKKQIIHPEVITEMAEDISIVYSPFNGTGNVPVRRIFLQQDIRNPGKQLLRPLFLFRT